MIPLVDLVAQYHTIKEEVDAALRQVLEKGTFILGPQVAALEEEIAAYLGVGHAAGVASGTDALILTLRACGIGPGDEVIVPAYTFFATAEAVLHVGATPVLIDIDSKSYCLDIGKLEEKISARTKAIIPVHLYGHPADMAAILEIAKSGALKVIEDNAQAMGAEYRNRKTGSLADAGCLSFFPSKNLGGYGDGGMIVTNDLSLWEAVRKLRTHGWQRRYYPEVVGFNSRLDELQAAILRIKLKHLDAWNNKRRQIADRYRAFLANCGVGLPCEASDVKHAYHLFVIRTSKRDMIQEHLRSIGVATGVYYPTPLHYLLPLLSLDYAVGAFPEAERAARETLAIPFYPEMTEMQGSGGDRRAESRGRRGGVVSPPDHLQRQSSCGIQIH